MVGENRHVELTGLLDDFVADEPIEVHARDVTSRPVRFKPKMGWVQRPRKGQRAATLSRISTASRTVTFDAAEATLGIELALFGLWLRAERPDPMACDF